MAEDVVNIFVEFVGGPRDREGWGFPFKPPKRYVVLTPQGPRAEYVLRHVPGGLEYHFERMIED